MSEGSLTGLNFIFARQPLDVTAILERGPKGRDCHPLEAPPLQPVPAPPCHARRSPTHSMGDYLQSLVPAPHSSAPPVGPAALLESMSGWQRVTAMLADFPGAPLMIRQGGESRPLGSLWLAEQLSEAVRGACFAQPRGLAAQIIKAAKVPKPSSSPERQAAIFGAGPGYALRVQARGDGPRSGVYLLRLPANHSDVATPVVVPPYALASNFSGLCLQLAELPAQRPAHMVLKARGARPSLVLGRLLLADRLTHTAAPAQDPRLFHSRITRLGNNNSEGRLVDALYGSATSLRFCAKNSSHDVLLQKMPQP